MSMKPRTLPPLNISGPVDTPFDAGSAVTRWYASNHPFLGVDGQWNDSYIWGTDPVTQYDPEYSCEVNTSGLFLGDEKDVRESIRRALDAHLSRYVPGA